jgi:hypothetical protein
MSFRARIAIDDQLLKRHTSGPERAEELFDFVFGCFGPFEDVDRVILC